MATFEISNQKLVSGASDTPFFVHGIYFYFNKSGTSYSNKTDWENVDSNVGNTVYGDGDLFASLTNGGSPTGTDEASNVHQILSDNTNMKFFVPNMDVLNKPWVDANDQGMPRGSHTYCDYMASNASVGEGHWEKIPYTGDSTDPASGDQSYADSHTTRTDAVYWIQASNQNGQKEWHENWIMEVAASNTNKIFAWFLMNEAYNSDHHREADISNGNKWSLTGHYNFCSNKENSSDRKPKMASFRGAGANTNWANTGWNNHSTQIDILNGNDYEYGDTWGYPYTTINMVKWCKSKIGTDTNKMIIASLPGRIEDNTNGLSDAKYFLYGSIIEGARGVLWYMQNNDDKFDYTKIKSNYLKFTNERVFDGPERTSDEDVVLSGSDVSSSFSTNESWTPTQHIHFPSSITKKFSAKVFKYTEDSEDRWRVYVVNNHSNRSTSSTFKLTIADTNIYTQGYSNAIDDSGTTNTMTADGNNYYCLEDSLSGYKCRIYDIGDNS